MREGTQGEYIGIEVYDGGKEGVQAEEVEFSQGEIQIGPTYIIRVSASSST